MSDYDVIVIGGGAAGLMAAGKAAQLGVKTLLLEKMDRPGRKLFISGKGRCNITNHSELDDFILHFGKNGQFLRQAFNRFFVLDLINFFHENGVPTITERGGRIFPESGSSQDVIDMLKIWARNASVEFRLKAEVSRLITVENKVTGVQIGDRPILAKAVITATGGASYPGTGSTGDGYRFAENVGHNIIKIRPALVPLVTAGNIAKKCQGLSLRNVEVKVWTEKKLTDQAFGEMLFTHFGVSGPIILTMSKKIVDSLKEKKEVQISIDLKPGLDTDKMDKRLRRDFDANGKKQFQTVLNGLLPQKLIPVCIERTNIPAKKVCNQINAHERTMLRNWLKDFRLIITGHRGFNQAIVTAGGVDTREVDPRTMESRLIDGLYFAGEVLDVDADTGGYNLQAAFSTGWLAGLSAAQKIKFQAMR